MHHVLGVCCVVFDIDGMLFGFFMNFLNIEKKIEFFISIFHVFSRFMLLPTLKKIFGVTIFFGGHNFFEKCGGGVETLLSRFISCFMLFLTLHFSFLKY